MANIRLCFLSILFFTCATCCAKSAVTYTFSGGRLGDNLVAVSHALALAVKYDLDFVYKPFEYSKDLMIDQLAALKYSEKLAKTYKKIIQIKGINTLNIDRDANYLYVVPYFPEIKQEYSNKKNSFAKTYFEVDWNDRDFYQALVALIKPKKSFAQPTIPENVISVALHVRRGGNFIGDPPLKSDPTYLNKPNKFRCFADVAEPLKFPPDTFYIEQLRTAAQLAGQKPLYVHIFTDDPNPQRLAYLYKSALQEYIITFDFRETGNRHDVNVLEDFFAMTHFDIIIRPNSNFSLMAFKLKNSGMEIAPSKATWQNGSLTITETERNQRFLNKVV
jgi:hypothetical protein